ACAWPWRRLRHGGQIDGSMEYSYPCAMGGPRRHRRGAAWLAIIALLSNVLLGSLGVAFAKASSPADELLGPLVICTANGAAVAPHDGGTQPGTPGDHCPSCTLIG